MTLRISVEGEPHEAYVTRTPKKIYLAVTDRDGKELLSRQYMAVAGDLEWKADWTEVGRLQVVFFEFVGPGPQIARTVLSLDFESPDGGDSYVETRVPAWLAATIASDLELADQRQILVLTLPLTAENQRAALSAVQAVSGKHELRSRTIPPNWVGPLAEYSAPGLQVEVSRSDSSGTLQLTVEDWDRREESEAIRLELADLSAVSTRRIVSASALLGTGGPEPALVALKTVADEEGLLVDDDPAPAYLASYRLPAVSDESQDAVALSASRLSSPDRIHVLIEDRDSRQKGLEVERAVREALARLGEAERRQAGH